MALRTRTMLVLFASLFNALWLAHVFAVLALKGHYPIAEDSPWMAWSELLLALTLAGFIIERMLRLRESR